MGTISEKLTYLNGTKQLLKQKINNLGGSIDDNTTFREYANQLQNVYDNLPKTEYQEGTEVNLGKTTKGKLDYENGVVGIGQSEQDTTTGINLCECKMVSVTNYGLTFTNNNDGTITISGENTYAGARTFRINQSNYTGTDNPQSYTDGAYTLDIGIANANLSMYLSQFSTWTTFMSTGYNTRIKSATISNVTNSFIYIAVKEGAVFTTPVTIKPMLVSGSYTTETMPNFEKYTGGQASPNPSYPQQIKSVTGTQNVVVRGKNWLKGSQDFSLENNGGNTSGAVLTGETYNNCAIRYYDTSEVEATTFKNFVLYGDIQTNLNINLKAGGIYTLSFWAKGEANNNFVAYFNGNTGYARNKVIDTNGIRVANASSNDRYDTDGACRFNGNITNEWQRFYIVWQLNPNIDNDVLSIAKHILFRQYGGDKIYICGIMFEEGQTLGNNYEPYITPTSYQLSLGDKELYEDSFIDRDSNGDFYFNDNFDKYTFTGSESLNFNSENNRVYTNVLASLIKKPSGDSAVPTLYANYLKAVSLNAIKSTDTQNGIAVAQSRNLNIKIDGLTSGSAYTTYIANNQLYVVYPLLQTKRTKITDATLISQLNAWYNAHSNTGTTIITSNGDLPLVLKVRGLKGE